MGGKRERIKGGLRVGKKGDYGWEKGMNKGGEKEGGL